MKESFSIIVKTISGLEEILAAELKELGAEKIQVLKRAVGFDGDLALLYRANYSCRTALRVLRPILEAEVREQRQLYDAVRNIAWEDRFGPRFTFAVDAVISGPVFTNSHYVAQLTKDAVADRLREKWGRRPSVSLDNPNIRINVHLQDQACTISLDSSGNSLHKRGYRKSAGPAPLNEVLAAGLIILSGWDRKSVLVDPMCGSGTLLIEAAMMARNIPAGHFRKEFGFMKWMDFEMELWHRVREKADAAIKGCPAPLAGSDRSPKAIQNARENVRFAGLAGDILLETCEFSQLKPPAGKGWLVTNPPYDERLQINDIIAFYKSIGDVLKKKFTGYQAWVISSDLKALKFIGLHPSRRITVFNGPLECRFVKFDLY
jgi:putative N6-adenine-specific DNA methylase